jgi:hypothetical protein
MIKGKPSPGKYKVKVAILPQIYILKGFAGNSGDFLEGI